MMNKKYILGGALFFLTSLSYGQDADNLIENPGFELDEKQGKKIKKLKALSALKDQWFSPTGVKADLFSEYAREDMVKVGKNIYGSEPAGGNLGNTYAGINAYSYNNREPRTYLTTVLLDKLSKGQEYCVKYHVSLADLSKYSVNNLGAYFSKNAIEVEGKNDIILDDKEFPVKSVGNKVYDNTFGFMPVCGIYTAKGGERYLTIGNFDETKNTTAKKVKKAKDIRGTQIPKAYYYIDNVSVEILTDENRDQCSCSPEAEKVVEVERVIYRKQSTNMEDAPDEDKVAASTIYFDHLTSQLEQDAKTDLDVLAKLLIDNPSYKIRIISHSTNDEIKKAEEVDYHGDLAQRRSSKIIEYFEGHGLDKGRFMEVIQDNKSPASSKNTPLAEAKNRRVEFELVK